MRQPPLLCNSLMWSCGTSTLTASCSPNLFNPTVPPEPLVPRRSNWMRNDSVHDDASSQPGRRVDSRIHCNMFICSTILKDDTPRVHQFNDRAPKWWPSTRRAQTMRILSFCQRLGHETDGDVLYRSTVGFVDIQLPAWAALFNVALVWSAMWTEIRLRRQDLHCTKLLSTLLPAKTFLHCFGTI